MSLTDVLQNAAEQAAISPLVGCGLMASVDRDDDQIFDEIASRVDAGLQLDEVPGRTDEALNGRGILRGSRRMYARGTPEFAIALAQGQLEPLPRTPPATLRAVQRAEVLVGAALPGLLRRLYLEVANGGFGPGYGVLGVEDGFREDMKRTAVDILTSRGDWPGMPDGLLTLDGWLAAWLDGSLRQPWLVTDPASGQYRGATIAETEIALADADGDCGS